VLSLSFVSVLLSDGAGFSRDGIINFHSHHQWAEDNTHGVLAWTPAAVQYECLGRYCWLLIGTPTCFAMSTYRQPLLNDFHNLLKDLLLVVR
jgi:hypothetical protein